MTVQDPPERAPDENEGDNQDPHVDDGLLELHVALEAQEAGLL